MVGTLLHIVFSNTQINVIPYNMGEHVNSYEKGGQLIKRSRLKGSTVQQG